MDHKTPKLTLEQGLVIQQEQLAHWKQRLNALCYEALLNEAAKMNEQLESYSTGYDVWKGTDMDRFIVNWKAPTHEHVSDKQAIHGFSD